jgi:GDP-L-fucose synthase
MGISCFVAGHNGLVGSSVVAAIGKMAPKYRVITANHSDLDLTDRAETFRYFERNRPNYVVLSAAKVGGILANRDFPVDFLNSNLRIQSNVIDAAFAVGVSRLIFLGSSCIYPRDCPQPIREEYLLTGPLEPTNRPYALAKIAGIEACWSYNRQYDTKYLAVMPTNLYGPGDNYHPSESHVLPGLIQRFHAARINQDPEVSVWGTGSALREFMFSADIGNAIAFILGLDEASFNDLVNPDQCPIINMGSGDEISIRDLALKVAKVIGYDGQITFDHSKPDGTPRKLLDSSRLLELGWKMNTKLDKGIKLAYQDYLSRI